MTQYNQQHQKVHTQLNIGNVTIHLHATQDVVVIMERAIRHLQRGLYDEALKMLDNVLANDDNIADAYYYHALALLKGKRPRATVKSAATRIDRDLQAGIMLAPGQAHYYYLLALVKYDFYLVNGFGVPPPDIDTLLTEAESLPLDIAKAKELLNHTNAPDCIVSRMLIARL
jgi:tetratricopeptide (TPR) repeat protein